MTARLGNRALACAVLSIAAIDCREPAARADDGFYLPSGPVVDALVVGVLAVAAADVVFTVHDATVLHSGSPSHGWSVAEVAVTAPQTAFLVPAFIAFGNHDYESSYPRSGESPFAAIIPAWTATLTMNGIWNLTSSSVSVQSKLGVSALVGVDTALTTEVVGRAIGGMLSPTSFAVTELVLGAPQVALGGYEIAHDSGDRAAWIAFTAWTGILVVHGVASLAVRAARSRATLRLPSSSVSFVPSAVGPSRAPGISMRGVF